MPGETLVRPIGLNFERIKLVPGKLTQTFLDKYPRLRKVEGIFPEIHITNPGQP